MRSSIWISTVSNRVRASSHGWIRASWSLVVVLVLAVACGQATAAPPQTAGVGAGFRYSSYGPPYDPGPDYWASVARQMAARFPGASPEGIWIVGTLTGRGTLLNFPGETTDPHIRTLSSDGNQEALSLFDEMGVGVWLQVEPGDASVEELIHLLLDRYASHRCVRGVGVDVEWYHAAGTPEGQAVTDREARAWVAAVRSHGEEYRLFLKHWEPAKMPPTARDGLVFIDDSQQFHSLDEMVAEFAAWGRAFSPAPVGFQFGYPADKVWWGHFDDPAAEIGSAILRHVPNTVGLYWVDFTVLEVFPR